MIRNFKTLNIWQRSRAFVKHVYLMTNEFPNCEVETQIYLSYDLEFISEQKMKELTDEITQIRRMIIGYKKTLN